MYRLHQPPGAADAEDFRISEFPERRLNTSLHDEQGRPPLPGCTASSHGQARVGWPRVDIKIDLTCPHLLNRCIPFAGLDPHHVMAVVLGGKRPRMSISTDARDPATASLEPPVLSTDGLGSGLDVDVEAAGDTAKTVEARSGAQDVPGRVARVIEACWQQEPSARPPLAEVVPLLEQALQAQLATNKGGYS